MEFLIVLAILLLVVAVVGAPLRREWTGRDHGHEANDELEPGREVAELEAARDDKYREIRDAELDHNTGKLSDADFEAVDRTLRAEAIELLKALDEANERLSAATIDRR
jgi:hypothetical protein